MLLPLCFSTRLLCAYSEGLGEALDSRNQTCTGLICGLGILGNGFVLKCNGDLACLTLGLDGMCVVDHVRICIDRDVGLVKAECSKTQSCCYIDILRKLFDAIPCRAVEYQNRLGHVIQIKIHLFDIGDLLPCSGGLSRGHMNRLNAGYHRALECVQCADAAGGNDELAAAFLCRHLKALQKLGVNKCAEAHGDEGYARSEQTLAVGNDGILRCALGNDIEVIVEKLSGVCDEGDACLVNSVNALGLHRADADDCNLCIGDLSCRECIYDILAHGSAAEHTNSDFFHLIYLFYK